MSMDMKILMTFLLFGIHQVSGIYCKFIPFTKQEFLAISFSNIMLCTVTFFFWDFDEMNIYLLVLSHRSLRPCSGFQKFFSLLLRLDDSISLSLSSLNLASVVSIQLLRISSEL